MSHRQSRRSLPPHMVAQLVDYATNVLPPQLQDLDNPRCCARCFSVCVRMLFVPDHQAHIDNLLVDNHDFFQACARMLSAPRRGDDLPGLQQVLRKNTSRCSNRAWHQHPGDGMKELVSLISCLYTCLTGVVGFGPRPVKGTSTFISKSRKGRWPLSLAQVLAHGTDQSVAAHVFWCHTFICPFSFMFLHKLLHIGRPTIIPHLLQDPPRVMLLESTLGIMRAACPRPHGSEPVFLDKYGLTGVDWARKPDRHIVEIAFSVLDAAGAGTGARFDDVFCLYAGHERAVLETLLALADTGIVREARAREALVATAVTLSASQRVEEAEAHPVIAAYRARRPLATTAGQFAYIVLAQHANLGACDGPGCLQRATPTGPDGPGKLRACARCQFVRYCTPVCQKADWKDRADGQRTSHKELCPILCKIRAAGCSILENRGYDFPAKFDRIKMDPADYQVLYRWAWTNGLVPEGIRAEIVANHEASQQAAQNSDDTAPDDTVPKHDAAPDDAVPEQA
ncbi:hypothetical protein AURDEDRAFT_114198 [Auricularia subglabra TFB-10046 SS5]|nr:hypothetical protein AURDEDRAFT_114198 [Auricularia subglabra TFB-10046 SS5]